MSTESLAGNPDCPQCQRLVGRVAELEAQLQQFQADYQRLQTLVADLQEQLRRNSSNSSIPPSANPPSAPKRRGKTSTGRKPGGQPGHPGHHRQRLPADRVTAVITYIPTTCHRCQADLPTAPQPGDPEPTWHQVAELPPLTAVITEHQGHARCCPQCGTVNRAPIPPEVRAYTIGPRLAATMSYLSGRLHLGRRVVEEVVESVFGAPTSLGSIVTLEAEMTAALEQPYAAAKAAVQAAPVKNTDETSWRQQGQRRWLWTAATTTVVCFVIHLRRSFAGLQALLGENIQGIVCSDRWSVYNQLPVEQRQVCWAHLKRDFQKLVERGGPAEAIGRTGLEVIECLFADWHAFRAGAIDRAQLQARVEPIARELQVTLETGSAGVDAKTATFCANLLALYPALWLFTAMEGVEPTNNHAERVLRPGVLWRKNAFGSHSLAGCRFVERMLTVAQTLRLQHRPVLDYLYEALRAHRAAQPIPQLSCPAAD